MFWFQFRGDDSLLNALSIECSFIKISWLVVSQQVGFCLKVANPEKFDFLLVGLTNEAITRERGLGLKFGKKHTTSLE